MTRARELVILAMDAGVSRGKVTAPTFDVETDLTYDVLRRILPTDALDMPQLDADRLVFDNSQPGDYELISLADFTFGEQAFEANASLDAEGRLVRGDADARCCRYRFGQYNPSPVLPTPSPMRLSLCIPRQWACAWASVRIPARDSYSYSSIAAALHAETEDRAAEARVPMDESGDDAESDGSEMTDADVAAVEPAGNPMALGSAFHAACQWLIEMGADALPAERADALARLWRLTPEQRERFDVALERWLKSAVRAELLRVAVRSCRGAVLLAGLRGRGHRPLRCICRGRHRRFGDRARPIRHAHWSSITRRVARRMRRRTSCRRSTPCRRASTPTCLHKAGFEAVTVKFVRVEQADPAIFVEPAEPQVVIYNL